MNVDQWIVALQHPLVLAGFGLFIFAALIKPLFLNNKKLSGTAVERLLHKGMNFAFALALLAIAGGLLLSWKNGGKLAVDKEKGNIGNQAVAISNNGTGTVMVINYGLSKEQYEEGRRKLANEIFNKIRDADVTESAVLELKLKAVQAQFIDMEKNWKEELARRKAADMALEQLKGLLLGGQTTGYNLATQGNQSPAINADGNVTINIATVALEQLRMQTSEVKINDAQAQLRQGNIEAAKEIFQQIADQKGTNGALAAYQLGQIAEGELEYAEALRQYKKAILLEEDNAEYLLAAGKMARELAEYSQAEEWYEHLLKIQEVGQDNARLGVVLNELALIYRLQGRYAEAEPLMHRALSITEKKFGKEHPALSAILNNLIVLYEWQRRFVEMEPIAERSLAICEKNFGEDHIYTSAALHNLAGTYYHQGKYKEAEKLYKRALVVREKLLGNDHPVIAMTLNAMANLYSKQGRYAEAEFFYRHSLGINENTFGNEHPAVADTIACLAGLYNLQGRYSESKPLYQQAIAILKKIFPDGHPTLDSLQKSYEDMKHKMAKQQ